MRREHKQGKDQVIILGPEGSIFDHLTRPQPPSNTNGGSAKRGDGRLDRIHRHSRRRAKLCPPKVCYGEQSRRAGPHKRNTVGAGGPAIRTSSWTSSGGKNLTRPVVLIIGLPMREKQLFTALNKKHKRPDSKRVAVQIPPQTEWKRVVFTEKGGNAFGWRETPGPEGKAVSEKARVVTSRCDFKW